MTVCKICSKPDCLGIGRPGSRTGKRCSGTIETEAHPYPLTDDQLEEIVEYELECFYHGKVGLPFNGRMLLSLIKEVRKLRKQVRKLRKQVGNSDGR